MARWKTLVFNACLNPICAITELDDTRVRFADGAVEGLRLAMMTIVATAEVLGYVLPEDYIDTVINFGPMGLYLKPSIQCDAEKSRLSYAIKWITCLCATRETT